MQIHETKIMTIGSFLIVTTMWLCVNVFGVMFPAMQIGFLFVLHTLLPLYDRTIYSREPSMNIYLVRFITTFELNDLQLNVHFSYRLEP